MYKITLAAASHVRLSAQRRQIQRIDLVRLRKVGGRCSVWSHQAQQAPLLHRFYFLLAVRRRGHLARIPEAPKWTGPDALEAAGRATDFGGSSRPRRKRIFQSEIEAIGSDPIGRRREIHE